MSQLRRVVTTIAVTTIAVASVVMHASAIAAAPRSTSAQGSQAPAKAEHVLEFMRLTGANNLADQMVQQMLASFQQAYPKVPASFWRTVIKKNETEQLIRKVAGIYGRYLTEQDVTALIAFYSSPVGRKFVAMQPKLVEESMVFGREWGERMSRRVMAELKRKKYVQ